jgi:hypothetical protein
MSFAPPSKFQPPALEVVSIMPAWVNGRGANCTYGQIIGCRVFQFFNHVSTVLRKEKMMFNNTGMDFPNTGNDFPNQGESFPFTYDISTDQGAYDLARTMTRRLVIVTQQDAKTVENAIHSISRQYRLGTFIENLWKGKPASITVPKFVRLNMGLTKATQFQSLQAQRDAELQKHLKRMGF